MSLVHSTRCHFQNYNTLYQLIGEDRAAYSARMALVEEDDDGVKGKSALDFSQCAIPSVINTHAVMCLMFNAQDFSFCVISLVKFAFKSACATTIITYKFWDGSLANSETFVSPYKLFCY